MSNNRLGWITNFIWDVTDNVPSGVRVYGAVLAAALLMSWPAIYNGFPLIFSGDSMTYLDAGRHIARALFRHDFSGLYGGERHLIYSLGILPFHWNINPWPIVGLNAVLIAYVLWLVVRSILPWRPLVAYFALVVPLSLFTSLSWFVSFIMADILGPVLYFTIFLIAFYWGNLSRGERLALVLIAWWTLISHASHLAVATGMCILLALLFVWQSPRRHLWRGAFARVAVIILVGILTQLALHNYLFHKPSVFGNQFPFLLARSIADGPGRWYLQQNCSKLNLAICEHVDELPDASWKFLWMSGGIWDSSSLAKQERLRKEELHVVLSAVSTYPWVQLYASATNLWHQLMTFGMWEVKTTPWVLKQFDTVLPRAKSCYLQSRQVHQRLHEGFYTWVQDWTVKMSLVVIGIWALLLRRNWSIQLTGLTAMIVYVVIANAAVTGIFNNVEPRFQARVIWLVPMLAGVLVFTWMDCFKPRRPSHHEPGDQP